MKRNFNLNEEERVLHEKAAKVRKMTDAQVLELIDSVYDKGIQDQAELNAEGLSKSAMEIESVRKFIRFLEERQGSGNRINRGTLRYLTIELENAIAIGVFD